MHLGHLYLRKGIVLILLQIFGYYSLLVSNEVKTIRFSAFSCSFYKFYSFLL